jgi:hypothetical protein
MARSLFWLWKALSRTCRAAGRASRASTTHGHLGHPACLEDGLSMARRSARLWAADNDL